MTLTNGKAQDTRTPLPIVRCPHCNKRLFDGFMVGEIMCPRGSCKRLVKFLAKEHVEAYSIATQA